MGPPWDKLALHSGILVVLLQNVLGVLDRGFTKCTTVLTYYSVTGSLSSIPPPACYIQVLALSNELCR